MVEQGKFLRELYDIDAANVNEDTILASSYDATNEAFKVTLDTLAKEILITERRNTLFSHTAIQLDGTTSGDGTITTVNIPPDPDTRKAFLTSQIDFDKIGVGAKITVLAVDYIIIEKKDHTDAIPSQGNLHSGDQGPNDFTIEGSSYEDWVRMTPGTIIEIDATVYIVVSTSMVEGNYIATVNIPTGTKPQQPFEYMMPRGVKIDSAKTWDYEPFSYLTSLISFYDEDQNTSGWINPEGNIVAGFPISKVQCYDLDGFEKGHLIFDGTSTAGTVNLGCPVGSLVFDGESSRMELISEGNIYLNTDHTVDIEAQNVNIFSPAGNSFKSSLNGILTSTTNSWAKVWMSADQEITTGGDYYAIEFDTVIGDPQNEWDATHGWFIPKESGYYLYNLCVRYKAISNTYVYFRLFADWDIGTSVEFTQEAGTHASEFYNLFWYSGVIYLTTSVTAGLELDIKYHSNMPATAIVSKGISSSGQSGSFFSVQRLL